jgi:hypothetical protein
MGTKKKRDGHAPVPPENQPQVGPPPDVAAPSEGPQNSAPTGSGAAFHEQDPQRRLGRYEGKGEHPIQQPGRRRGDRD